MAPHYRILAPIARRPGVRPEPITPRCGLSESC